MAHRDAALEAAFAATDYQVALPQRTLHLRVGHTDADTDAALRSQAGVRAQWLILTPYNPGAKARDDAWNRDALRRLEIAVSERHPRRYRTCHRDPRGHWPDEHGLLLPDATLDESLRLGHEYGQQALLFGRLGTAPQLIWLDDAD